MFKQSVGCISELHILMYLLGPGPFPAILDMWGGGGGLMEYRAALLASRGYAVLALAYTGHKDVPPSKEVFEPKLSYFEVRKVKRGSPWQKSCWSLMIPGSKQFKCLMCTIVGFGDVAVK